MRRSGHWCCRGGVSLFMMPLAVMSGGVGWETNQMAFAGEIAPMQSLSVDTKAASVDGDAAYNHPGFAATGLMVKRVSIDGLQAGDLVSVVFGMQGGPLTIKNSAGPFFNTDDHEHASNGHGRPSPLDFAEHPELQWDTWLAIGTSIFSVSPNFPNIALAGGGNNIDNHLDAAWFNFQGVAPTNGKVLIGQFAFPEGSDFEINLSAMINGANVMNLHYSYSAPEPTGACCVDGRCMVMTQAACETLGQVIDVVYHGNGSNCDTNNCDPRPLTGACCVANDCQILSAEACALVSGTFHADQTCDQVECAPPPPQEGACCVFNDCVQLTEAFCNATGVGIFHGVGVRCEQVQCGASQDGACCVFGECQQMTQEICTTAMGTFHGVGVACNLIECGTSLPGACCLMGQCSSLTQSACETAGGTFHGEGMPCVAVHCPVVPPTGACCVVGVCEVKTLAQCHAAGGVYSGHNSECADIVCLPTGACMVQNVCATLTADMCEAAGGAFQGLGTPCNGQHYPSHRVSGSANRVVFWEKPLPRYRDYSHWPEQLSPQDSLADLFDIPSCISDSALHNSDLVSALKFRNPLGMDGAARLLLREAVAAVLNAQATQNETCTLDFPIADPADIVAIVNQTLSRCNTRAMYELAVLLSRYNNMGSQCQEAWYLRQRRGQ